MDKEIRELVRDLADALLGTVSRLEDAQDDFEEGAYAKEMTVYIRAMMWLHEQNKA